MPDFVRAVNVGTKPFTFHFLDVKKRIPPGGETGMPWSLAVTLFGNPFAVNADKRPDRTDSLRRARSNFNYELGMETMEAFEARRPPIEIYDMETGQRIFMLIEDPEGEHADQYISPEAESTDQMTLLQRQVAALTAQLTVLIQQRSAETPAMNTGQSITASIDAPDTVIKSAEFIDGNAFAQRPEDQVTNPLFDFSKLSSMSADELPPSVVLFDQRQPGEAGTDVPADIGVGSAHDDAPPATASPKLAPRPG